MKYGLDFLKLGAELMPPQKRKPVRVAWMYRLMAWLRRIHAEFVLVQSVLERESRVTSQVIVLESYLQDVIGQGVSIVVAEVNTTSNSVISSADD